MSAHLLAAALACDEGNTFDCEAASRDGKDENLVHEAMSHTATDGMHDATDEAISHTSSPDPKDARGKKRPSGGAVGGKAAKRGKVEPMFQAAAGADGMLQCMFVEGECIPLWPQYVDRTAACNFIRVGAQEDWVIQFMVASRKSVAQANEKDAFGGSKKMDQAFRQMCM